MKYFFLSSRPCQTRPTLVIITSNEPLHYPFIVNFNKCSRSSNAIDDQYAQLCVPDKVRNMNVKLSK